MKKNIKNKKPRKSYQVGMYPRDIKKQCIMLGIPFEHVSDGIPELMGWLDELAGNKPDKNRLKEYDEWITKIIKGGKHSVDANSLLHKDLLFHQEELPDNSVDTKPKGKKEKKPSMGKDKFGFRRGTKKSRVAELVDKGCSVKLIRKKMVKEFGDINEQSLKIWVRKSKELINAKK